MTGMNKAGNNTKSLGEKLQHKIGKVFQKKNATKPAFEEFPKEYNTLNNLEKQIYSAFHKNSMKMNGTKNSNNSVKSTNPALNKLNQK